MLNDYKGLSQTINFLLNKEHSYFLDLPVPSSKYEQHIGYFYTICKSATYKVSTIFTTIPTQREQFISSKSFSK